MIPSTVISSSKNAPTSILDLPTDCLNFIFNSLSCAADREALGLTCHKFLLIQNLNRLSLQFECSLTLHTTSSWDQQLVVGPAQLHRLLTRFPNLTSLSLSGCTELTDISIEDIQHSISSLKSLSLDCCFGITDNGISLMAGGCPLLQYISLYRCNVTDTGLESISKLCRGLEDINLSHCELITDNGVNKLAKNCRQLYNVKVPSCWEVNGTGFEGCSQTLASIEAYSCTLKPEGIKGMVSGGGLEYLDISNQGWSVYGDCFGVIGEGLGRRLRFLNMRLCRSAGNESVVAIAKGCPLLEEWNLSLCHWIQLSGWEAIGVNCNCLLKLAVYRCKNIYDDGLMALRNGCKSLKVLYISGCSQVSSNAIELFRMVRGDVEINGEEIISVGPVWAFQR